MIRIHERLGENEPQRNRANEKPLIMKYRGRIYFPALYDYPLLRAPPELMKAGFRHFASFRQKLEAGHENWLVMPPIPYSDDTQDLGARYAPPGGQGHLLGTDDVGRDTAARLIHGIKISLSIGLVAMGIAFTIGIAAGAVAGYFGGWAALPS